MRHAIDIIVCICMMVALYINLTDFPKPALSREVRGFLEKAK